MNNSTKIIIFLSVIIVLILISFAFISHTNQQQKQEKAIQQDKKISSSQKNETQANLKDTTAKINHQTIEKSIAKENINKVKKTSQSVKTIPNLELPELLNGEELITHTGFQLVYNEAHEQAKWVCYQFTKAETIKIANRSDNFREDEKIKTRSATDNDYKKSGYDRGHLAPAGDMSWSEEAMSCSFYYSNMSPQTPSFNRGIWKNLEEQIRNWVIIYDTLYVVTGPVLEENLPSIGSNQVSVPNYYYKVILDVKNERKEAIGFLLPNQKSNLSLQNFVVAVDSVEKLTGINFFHLLPDNIENLLEKKVCKTCWKW